MSSHNHHREPKDPNPRKLPPYSLNTPPVVVNDLDHANSVLATILPGCFIGFDVECGPRKISERESACTTADARRKFQLAELEAAGPEGYVVPWDDTGVSIIQVATANDVFILDMKKIRAVPFELKRILEDLTIFKCGCGVLCDGKYLWEDLRVQTRSFCDLGYMLRIGEPEKYAKLSGNVSLQDCVADCLYFYLDKTDRTEHNWGRGLPSPTEEHYEDMLKYAALDARASYDLYDPIFAKFVAKELYLGHELPFDWFVFNFMNGKAIRTQLDVDGMEVGWAYTVCQWYKSGKFSGYWGYWDTSRLC
ncbi:ribonuclease H-like domain-containing protein [Favolaschia claudopus]|uniref:Ribonuclease H-like domain-containing protein n=1 Tax=Favolaschia claudopus TaxID=2862362 RepID=A0AAW0B0Q2_9AGAR